MDFPGEKKEEKIRWLFQGDFPPGARDQRKFRNRRGSYGIFFAALGEGERHRRFCQEGASCGSFPLAGWDAPYLFVKSSVALNFT